MTRLRIALGAVLLALVAGCGSLAAAGELSAALGQEGFANPSVNVSTTNGVDTVTVTSSGHSSLTGEDALQEVAETVWTTFPRRFDRLEVTVGADSGSIGRDGLEAIFGPRDPALDARTIGSDFVGPLIGFGVGALLFIIAIIVLIVLLVRRSRRRRERRGPPGPMPPPGAPGGPPPPGWQQQPPPGWQQPPPGYPPPGGQPPG